MSPDTPTGRTRLEDIEFESLIPLYEQALGDDPRDIHALHWLGNAYTRTGRYDEGLELDRRLTEIRPDDPIAHYNLACSLALTGKADQAFETLERAIRLGYRDVEHMKVDDDLVSIRKDGRFLELVRKLAGL